MNYSLRLNDLRFRLDRAYRQERPSRPKSCPPLHLLLAIPISERLILLSRVDGDSPQEIKALLHAKDDDVHLRSDRMVQAVQILNDAQHDPFLHWPSDWFKAPLIDLPDITDDVQTAGFGWDERHGHAVERAFRQVLFSTAAPCLFGECVPALLRNMTLRERALIYCLVVEEMEWEDAQHLLGCSEWALRVSIKKTFEYLEQPAYA